MPCEAGTPPLSREVAQKCLQEIPDWILAEDHIVKEFKFRKYLDGLQFAYSVGEAGEEEGHHPDMLVKYRRVKVTLSTHAIKGLSENDFIMAAKAEQIYKKLATR